MLSGLLIGSAPVSGGGTTDRLLLVDGTSFLLLTDGTSHLFLQSV